MMEKARWIYDCTTEFGDEYACSNCGCRVSAMYSSYDLPERCDSCGSDMRNTPTETTDTPIKDSGERREFNTGAVRDMSEGKGDMASVPWEAILRLSKHYENGAKKYERWNFRKGIPLSSFIDSACRHLAKYQCGMDDEDHLSAAAFNVLGAMLMENIKPEMIDLPLREGKKTFGYFEENNHD